MASSKSLRFPRVFYGCITIGMYLQLGLVFGCIFSGAHFLFQASVQMLDFLPPSLTFGFSAAMAFLGTLFGFGGFIILVSALLGLRLRAGTFPMVSIVGMRWATYNFYILLYRYTVMNFIKGTPFQAWFYRLLGATIGKGVQINSTVIADCNLLTIGDFSMIGGEATVICHSYERGKLVLQPVTIGRYVDIGLNTIILPGVTIGDHAIVAAGAVVPKNTQIPPYTIWAGVPAKQIRDRVHDDHLLA